MSLCDQQYPSLAALLDVELFEACQVAIQRELTQELSQTQPDDRKLACLHVLWCRTLLGLREYHDAALKAEHAVLLARKVKDVDLLGEALFRAGFCYVHAANHRNAIERFTECINHGPEAMRAKAFHNRGHAYVNQWAYALAVPDYEEALRLAVSDGPLVRQCRVNLAWALIMLREFPKAEALLAQLAEEASNDRWVELQVAHDRLHISVMAGRRGEAIKQALAALRQAGNEYPEVRAHIALTLMALSIDRNQSQNAFTLGVLAKRLAGQARRADLEEEASWQMRKLEFQAGSECLIQSLLQTRQLPTGWKKRQKATNGGAG